MIKVDFNPPLAQLRQFGWFSLVGFPAIATVFLWTQFDWQPNVFVYVLFGLGGLCPVLAMVAPKLLLPIYVALMCIAIPIGFVVSAVLLRLIYYLVITPMALWFRVRGRDAMHRDLDREAESYWADHRDVARPRSPSSYLRLY